MVFLLAPRSPPSPGACTPCPPASRAPRPASRVPHHTPVSPNPHVSPQPATGTPQPAPLRWAGEDGSSWCAGSPRKTPLLWSPSLLAGGPRPAPQRPLVHSLIQQKSACAGPRSLHPSASFQPGLSEGVKRVPALGQTPQIVPQVDFRALALSGPCRLWRPEVGGPLQPLWTQAGVSQPPEPTGDRGPARGLEGRFFVDIGRVCSPQPSETRQEPQGTGARPHHASSP